MAGQYIPVIQRIAGEVKLRAVLYDDKEQNSPDTQQRIDTAYWDISNKLSIVVGRYISRNCVEAEWQKEVGKVREILLKASKSKQPAPILREIPPYMQFMVPHLEYNTQPISTPIERKKPKTQEKKSKSIRQNKVKDIKSHYKIPEVDPYAVPQFKRMESLQSTLEDLTRNFQQAQQNLGPSQASPEENDDYFIVIFSKFQHLPSQKTDEAFCELLGIIHEQAVKDENDLRALDPSKI